jgi:P4 family phage/plasmid primase-like protien
MTAAEITRANPLDAHLTGRGVALVGAGKQKTTNRCPNTEHKPGHLCVSVNCEKQVWHCNDCGTGGDVIRWMALEQGKSDADVLKSFNGGAKPPPTREKGFDWALCVAALTAAHKRNLADWRGYSLGLVDWLYREKVVGIHASNIAFAVHEGGRVVGCHYLANRSKKLWRYHPKGNGTHPLVFGNPGSAAYVLCFESQWDAFAVMDKFSWHTCPPDGYAVIITRGADNGKLVKGQCSPDANLYAFVQNDGAAEKWAAEKWLNNVCRFACCKEVLCVTTPPPHKDANDWTRAGATLAEIEAAIRTGRAVVASKPPPDGRDGHHSATPSQWFSDKYPSLPAEFGEAILESTDENGTVSARDIGEDFLAATLGEKGSPEVPTIFLPTEEKFYTYSLADGVFGHEREAALLAQLSRELLQCARDCKQSGCETKTLEFRFRDAANLSGVLRKARGLLAVPHDFFSTDLADFIPCANGMLRLEDKTLLPFSPSYRRRNKLAVLFNPSAKCILFLDTLMRPALDDEELDLLQRWCGLALIGENVAQRFPILTGTAGGGKGTFIRVLTGIIGQTNLASLRPQLLGERFELGRFLGKTLLYGADVPENFLNQRGASVLKSLTGGDPVTLEFKNSNENPSIICRFNVIVTCNSRLTVHLEGDTEAWRRRLAIIEYHKPKPGTVIADLDQQILRNESSGVLNWMLEGLDKLRADGWQLSLTGKQQSAVDNLLLESDGHAVFAREGLRPDAARTLTVQDCYAAYVEFCNQHGWTALTRNRFTPAITDEVVRQFGITSRNDIQDHNEKSQRGWKGLSLAEKLP